MNVERDQTSDRSQLTEMAIVYFEKKGFKINNEDVAVEGYSSGESRHFDLIVEKKERSYGAQGVWIRDWNRTIGVNVIITLDNASDDAGLTNPIMIGDKFSSHAKAYAKRRKIEILTKQDLERFR
ncbi:MAG: restriction endonuclease [Candidatus Bathyarchaeota archaeon]|nr:restriction endonuclease [Candidatus Termiticorpusculum sp.]